MACCLVIQGRLRPDGAAQYGAYLQGTRSLMRHYDVAILAAGLGVDLLPNSVTWPVNALLGFPHPDAADAFFRDPEYQDIKTRYRDKAYAHLELVLFQTETLRGYQHGSLVAVIRDCAEIGVGAGLIQSGPGLVRAYLTDSPHRVGILSFADEAGALRFFQPNRYASNSSLFRARAPRAD